MDVTKILAELRQEEHVRETTVHEPCGGHAERQQRRWTANDRERGPADRRHDLRQPGVARIGVHGSGTMERDARRRGVAPLEETARLAREPFPRNGGVVVGERAQEGRRQELCRMLERDLVGAHQSSLIRRTARNASCGISTAPTIFIRFLPFFCFSRSFFLRVMSPP